MAFSDRLFDVPSWGSWRNGDWGMLDTRDGQAHYASLNCQVYENGSLGVRPGWREIAVGTSGAPLGARALVWRDPAASGKLGYLHVVSGADLDELRLWPIIADATSGIIEADPAEGPVALTGVPDYPTYAEPTRWWSQTAPPPLPLHVAYEASGQLTTVGGRVHRVLLDGGGDPDPGFVPSDDDGDSLGLSMVELFGVRLFGSGNAEQPTRVYYSTDNVFTDWETAEGVQQFVLFLPGVGDNVDASAVVGLKRLRNGLLLASLDGSLSAMRGPTPTTGNLSLLAKVGAPPHPAAMATCQSMIYFLPKDGRGVVSAALDVVDTRTLAHLRIPREPSMGLGVWPTRGIAEDHYGYIRLGAVREWDELSSPLHLHYALERCNGSWTVAEAVVADSFDVAVVPGGRIARVFDDADGKYHLQVRDQTLNRPSRGSDAWSNRLSHETFGADARNPTFGVLFLPEFLPMPGVNVAAREIVVEVDYWRWSDGDMPWCEVQVIPMGEGVLQQPASSLLDHNFEGRNFLADVPSTTDNDPRRFRFVVPIDEITFERGFQVVVRFRSCAIRQVLPRWDLAAWVRFIEGAV